MLAGAGREGAVQVLAADVERLAALLVVGLREGDGGGGRDGGAGEVGLAGVAPVFNHAVEIGVVRVGK